MAYYVDHLCVHPDFRKTGVAPRLIQTHEYAQRHRNKKIAISIFKRDTDLTGIIPIMLYMNYVFDILKWKKPSDKQGLIILLKLINLIYIHCLISLIMLCVNTFHLYYFRNFPI